MPPPAAERWIGTRPRRGGASRSPDQPFPPRLAAPPPSDIADHAGRLRRSGPRSRSRARAPTGTRSGQPRRFPGSSATGGPSRRPRARRGSSRRSIRRPLRRRPIPALRGATPPGPRADRGPRSRRARSPGHAWPFSIISSAGAGALWVSRGSGRGTTPPNRLSGARSGARRRSARSRRCSRR